MALQSHKPDALSGARLRAAAYEANLEPAQRKRLGQFFSGVPLSRLLAALSVREGCSTLIDPMAGHGDLLDAALERLSIRGHRPQRVDAVEIDPETASFCAERLAPWIRDGHNSVLGIHPRSAFDASLWRTLQSNGYDLVITNPPYVRYQTVARNEHDRAGASTIRQALLEVADDRTPRSERPIWRELIEGYSGLADLSVPSWLLAAMLVRPGGVLALVAPATWRTRNYADILQYLMARCYNVEAVVADRQPGWFSQALVRTNLVVARRLPTDEVIQPLRSRSFRDQAIYWTDVAPEAKMAESLVGAAFPGEDPEGRFADWLLSSESHKSREDRLGLCLTQHQVQDEVSAVLTRARAASWIKQLEPTSDATPLFGVDAPTRDRLVPQALRSLLPREAEGGLIEIGELGIAISQGLRTGCNGFFYVDFVEQLGAGLASVRVSDLLGGGALTVPFQALKPVLRRQAEIGDLVAGKMPPGRLLDLRMWVLPEDWPQTEAASLLYRRAGSDLPKVMPDELAAHVRRAAQTVHDQTANSLRIPELSAVKTNVRPMGTGPKARPPRFWYMLPDFARRHSPDAFVPRINQGVPWVVVNPDCQMVIDANFSTLWGTRKIWTPYALCGLLNSSWVRACMEAIGTPMGGGALKLEAAHLCQLPVPQIEEADIRRIDDLARSLPIAAGEPAECLDRLDAIVVNAILHFTAQCDIESMVRKLRETMNGLQLARQRG